MKHFSEQGFIHRLFHFDWAKINLIADADVALKCFYDVLATLLITMLLLRGIEFKAETVHVSLWTFQIFSTTASWPGLKPEKLIKALTG